VTTPGASAIGRLDAGSLVGRLRFRPAEGWLTVALVGLLVATLAWSIDDAAWVPSSEGSTGYLVWLAFGGAAVELLGAKAGWGRWRTHVLGAVIAGLLLPIVAGSLVLGSAVSGFDLASIALRYRAAGDVAFRVWADLVRDGRPFTSQFGHYHMVFGALVWAAGQLAATAVFARRRPLDAVVVIGLLLLANMSITERDQLQFLVIFSIAALVLLIRTHTFDEQVTWMRRRIGDPQAISALYLRGGGIFVAGAVLGALFLTATASSSPLQGWWAGMPQRLQGLSDWIQKFAPTGGDPRGLGTVGFGPSALTNGLWSPSNAVAFRAKLAPTETAQFFWRAGTYAVYDGVNRWSWGDTGAISRAAGDPLLTGTGDDPALLTGRREVQATITPDGFTDSTVISPQTIKWVDRAATVRVIGDRFTTVEAGGGGSYTIAALIPTVGGANGLTENKLRAAGTTYPDDITRQYLAVPDHALGPAALSILGDVRGLATGAGGPRGNPYDLAKTMETYLRSDQFHYQADVRDLIRAQCSGLSSIECFARTRHGYCEYYAGTMALLLRAAGIPTRIAYGFLPTDRTADGLEVVSASAAHWWVEVYFPGYGWVEFNPTGGIGQAAVLPSGPPVTPAPPGAVSTARIDRETDVLGRGSQAPIVGPGLTSASGSGPFIFIAILLAIGVGAVALASWRRAPRKPMDPDVAWGALGRLASRFGFGPRPAQTVYEYAGMLGDAVPAVRAELQTVARAKVEVAYGRRELGLERLRSVGEAYRRLRLAMLRFGLRRLPRRRR
jgi:transglutaminase-like putative cysteine protease